MPLAPSVSIEVVTRGRVYTGWRRVEVTSSLTALSGRCRLELASEIPWPLVPGSDFKVQLRHQGRTAAAEVLLDGFVDSVDAKGDAERGTTLEIGGRDRTGDLVDSSPDLPSGEFQNVDAAAVIEALADERSIPVVRQAALDVGDPFERFAINPGETAWLAMERAARMRGLLVYTEAGSLHLAVAGFRRSEQSLRQGVNVKGWSLSYNNARRHSVYIVRGQRIGHDWDDDPALIVAPEGRASDPEIERTRPLVVLAESTVDAGLAEERAQWEASIRAARAARLLVTVAGWTEYPRGGAPSVAEGGPDAGSLWRPNTLVPCKIDKVELDTTLLLDTVHYVADRDEGTTAQLTLVREDAYTKQPDIDLERNPFSSILERWRNG